MTLRARDAKVIVSALRAGVVPKVGLQHIQVGRKRELEELLKDLGTIKDGASSLRFIIGDYGSGKTFFLSLSRLIALKQNFVVMHADLAPNRKIYSTNRQSLALYRECSQNISTRNKTSGDALEYILERFINKIIQRSQRNKVDVNDLLDESLEYFRDLSGGYDFAQVVQSYWRGYEQDNEELQFAAMRWLRGEYTTKTEARKDLGVRTIITDENYYDHIKLFSRFVKKAGYHGLLIFLDEMVNICYISHRKSRNANYEFILRMLNDILQGETQYLGVMMGGTTDFLEDQGCGVFSHEALRTRLRPNSYATEDLLDFSGPVIRLSQFTKEDLFALLQNIRNVMDYSKLSSPIPDQALKEFMGYCFGHIGEAYFRTPRKTIKSFVDFVSLLQQNPQVSWKELLSQITVEEDQEDSYLMTS